MKWLNFKCHSNKYIKCLTIGICALVWNLYTMAGLQYVGNKLVAQRICMIVQLCRITLRSVCRLRLIICMHYKTKGQHLHFKVYITTEPSTKGSAFLCWAQFNDAAVKLIDSLQPCTRMINVRFVLLCETDQLSYTGCCEHSWRNVICPTGKHIDHLTIFVQ